MKKLFLLLISFLIFSVPLAYAHCLLCTMAVGAAAVTAKYYGVDTSIIGIFAGALAISIGLWIGLKIKKQYIRYQLPIIVILSFIISVVPIIYSISSDSFYLPLLIYGAAGSLLNKVYWINKLLLGSFWLHIYIKKVKGKVLFPFQGIAITLVLLALTSLIIYISI